MIEDQTMEKQSIVANILPRSLRGKLYEQVPVNQ